MLFFGRYATLTCDAQLGAQLAEKKIKDCNSQGRNCRLDVKDSLTEVVRYEVLGQGQRGLRALRYCAAGRLNHFDVQTWNTRQGAFFVRMLHPNVLSTIVASNQRKAQQQEE